MKTSGCPIALLNQFSFYFLLSPEQAIGAMTRLLGHDLLFNQLLQAGERFIKVDLQAVIFLSGSHLRHKGTTIEQKKAEKPLPSPTRSLRIFLQDIFFSLWIFTPNHLEVLL